MSTFIYCAHPTSRIKENTKAWSFPVAILLFKARSWYSKTKSKGCILKTCTTGELIQRNVTKPWIPACAGMTTNKGSPMRSYRGIMELAMYHKSTSCLMNQTMSHHKSTSCLMNQTMSPVHNRSKAIRY